MKILATGIRGTIGKHLSNKVIPIDIDLSSALEEFLKIEFNAVRCVVHLAGVVGPSLVEKDLGWSHQINVEGTKKLALAALEGGVQRFVYVSTSHVYKPSSRVLTEESEIGPLNAYAEQKYEAEQAVREIFENNPSKFCIVRIFSVLDWNVRDFTLGGGIKRLAFADPNFELRNSDDVRDFLTPKRIAWVLLKIANEPRLTGTVNLCTGRGLTVRQAAIQMLTESGFNINLDRIHSGNSLIPFMVGDNLKLLSHIPNLGIEWSPSRFEW